ARCARVSPRTETAPRSCTRSSCSARGAAGPAGALGMEEMDRPRSEPKRDLRWRLAVATLDDSSSERAVRPGAIEATGAVLGRREGGEVGLGARARGVDERAEQLEPGLQLAPDGLHVDADRRGRGRLEARERAVGAPLAAADASDLADGELGLEHGVAADGRR